MCISIKYLDHLEELEADSAVVRHDIRTPTVSSETHTSSVQNLSQSDDLPNMTIIPETQPSPSKLYQIAKQVYAQKMYSVPKEPLSDVLIRFTDAPTSEGLHFSSSDRARALSEKSKLKSQSGGVRSDVSIRVSFSLIILHFIRV